MSREDFIKRFAADKAFAERVMALEGPKEAKEFAEKEGYTFTDEEIGEFLEGMAKLRDGASLSNADLDLAVGGMSDDELGTDCSVWCSSLECVGII